MQRREITWLAGQTAWLLYLVPLVGLPADAAAADPPAATPGAAARGCRQIEPNGPQFTGTRMTLQTPGCPPVPDIQLRVADLTRGVALPGPSGKVYADVVLHGGELGGQQVKGPELIGALLLGEGELGGTVRLRLDDIEQAPDPNPKTPINENADVFRYRISYQFGSGNGPADASFHPSSAWQPLCSGDNQAIAVAGEWDLHQGTAGSGGKRSSSERAVTFACVGSAVAKCVERLGYKPWQSITLPGSQTRLSLDELHQSCVRAVRADYCGTGESLTRTGEHVNFYDRLGINRDDSDWPLEAQWTPRGASCVAGTRLRTAPADARVGRPAMPTRAYVEKTCPKVWAAHCPATPGPTVLWTEATPSSD